VAFLYVAHEHRTNVPSVSDNRRFTNYLNEQKEIEGMRADLNRYEDKWTAQAFDCHDGTKHDDLAFWTRLATESESPTLELACGTGRVVMPLAQAGLQVVGLEISQNMLAIARRKLARAEPEVRARVRLVQGDMTSFALQEQFGLIFIAFHSFQALLARDEQRGCLECCRRHLQPDGKLALNVFHPRLSLLAAPGSGDPAPEEFVGPEGVMVRETGHTDFDIANQRLTAQLQYECTASDGQVTVRKHLLELRYFFRFEMEWMLETCGLEVEALYGNFDRSPFRAESPEMIFVARTT
jgi:SAM-dependent methyltransferase